MGTNPVRFEVNENVYASLENQVEGAVDENEYLRPISNSGNLKFVEESKNSGINLETNHQNINSKCGEINNAIVING